MKTLDQILEAKTFQELFPEGTKREYRGLLKTTHPDLHPDNREKAQKAFVHVTTLWTYRTVTPPSAQETAPENTIITKRHTYTRLQKRRVVNNIITYEATYDADVPATILIANHPKVGDMLIEGTRNLKTILDFIPEEYRDFFVKTEDTFRVQQTPTQKTVGIMQTSMKDYYTLQEVLEDYPEGIGGEDLAWIYRRMLVAVGNAHDAGYAHAAPTITAFHIKPQTHEVKLNEWQYSQELGQPVTMLTPDTRKHYTDDKTTSVKKDLQITAEAIVKIMNTRTTAKRMQNFLKAMTRYPTDTAAEGLGEFDALLKDLYGERKFHVFRMRRAA